jgi:hypothetical protein
MRGGPMLLPKDTNWSVFKSFVDFDLYGYAKTESGHDPTTTKSYVRIAFDGLIQDVLRVLGSIGNNFLNGTPANVYLPSDWTTNIPIDGTPHWLLSAKDENERPVTMKIESYFDVETNTAAFWLPFKAEILWHDSNLGSSAPTLLTTDDEDYYITDSSSNYITV